MGSSAQHDSRFRSSIEELDVKEHEEKIEIVPQTPMERQIALEAALKVDPGVKRFSWAAIQVRVLAHNLQALFLNRFRCISSLS